MPTYASHFADLPGLRMHYLDEGPRDGAPVVLLHGYPEFSYCWHFQIAALVEEGFRCVVPDQRGYFLTGKTGPYNMSTLAEDVVHLMDQLSIDRAPIVAHDFGAPVAYTTAWRYPDRVERLAVINGPHPNAFLDTLHSRPRQWLRSWYILFMQLPWLPEMLFRAFDYNALNVAFAEVPEKNFSSDDLEAFKSAFRVPGAVSGAMGWYRALVREYVKHGRPQPRMVIAPTLLIWGEEDVELGPHINDTLERYVPNLTKALLPGVAHFAQLDAPELCNEHLLAFLKGIDNDAE